jgi:hypothetical protein
VLDAVLEDPAHAVAIECAVHPDGPAAHIRRRLALDRAGWTVLEAFPSRWGERPAEVVVELLHSLPPTHRA